MLSLAVILMIGSAVLTVADHYISKKSERERTADLVVLQKLSSSLTDLGFELELKEVDSSSLVPVRFQMLLLVNTTLSSSGRFGDYYVLIDSGKGNWLLQSAGADQYKNLKLDLDSSGHRLRFVLANFNISTSNKPDRPGWQPNNIADLGIVRMELNSGPESGEDYKRYYDSEWCPIVRVSIFANNFEPENLLAVAERAPKRKGDERLGWHTFLPTWARDYSNPNVQQGFWLEPVRLRDSWLKSNK